MKRQLTEIEKSISKNSIESLKGDIKYGEAMLKYYNLQINELMPLNYERKIKEFKENVKQLIKEIELSKNIITETTRQIKEGVDVKDEKDKK